MVFAFNLDPIPYSTAVAQRLGSLDFSVDALLKIPWQSMDPQVIAANTGTRIRDPFYYAAQTIEVIKVAYEGDGIFFLVCRYKQLGALHQRDVYFDFENKEMVFFRSYLKSSSTYVR